MSFEPENTLEFYYLKKKAHNPKVQFFVYPIHENFEPFFWVSIERLSMDSLVTNLKSKVQYSDKL